MPELHSWVFDVFLLLPYYFEPGEAHSFADVGLQAAETLTFFATSDWGGQGTAPYTTPLQLAMAEAMGHVGSSFHPKFVLSAGGNFLPAGLPGESSSSLAVRSLTGRPAAGSHRSRLLPRRCPCHARAGPSQRFARPSGAELVLSISLTRHPPQAPG